MTRDLGSPPLHRCLLVWLAASGGAGAVIAFVLPDLLVAWAAASAVEVDTAAFDRLLVWVCEVAVVGCAGWSWVVTSIVVADAARGQSRARVGVPLRFRRLVRAACGVALVGGLAVPAHASAELVHTERRGQDVALVRGLILPDRATAARHVSQLLTRRIQAREQGSVVVRPGDTLWGLASTSLPAGGTAAAIADRWQEIYRANRAVIGDDPDLIQPQQRLLLPRR